MNRRVVVREGPAGTQETTPAQIVRLVQLLATALERAAASPHGGALPTGVVDLCAGVRGTTDDPIPTTEEAIQPWSSPHPSGRQPAP
jgi:hypothetical protein